MLLRHDLTTLDARSGFAEPALIRSWQKLALLAALVFVPVPALTASGLAVPLPSVVS